jgi:hypothetical protein
LLLVDSEGRRYPELGRCGVSRGARRSAMFTSTSRGPPIAQLAERDLDQRQHGRRGDRGGAWVTAEHAQEQLDRRVGLREFEVERGDVLAQEAHQVRRHGILRVELRHRRRDQQQADLGKVAQLAVGSTPGTCASTSI